MIRVTEINIKEFRGIRDLTIKFDGKNFAICGPNGTGKSGVVDALEFALTGNISRLSGKGTKDISMKDHAPHVDSRNDPDKARVKITLEIPSLKKTVVIERSVKDSSNPSITPTGADILHVLKQVALHPEITLSRRELIRYVISTPGDRSKEVQALLRLDEVENLRTTLQKIANASKRDLVPLNAEKEQAAEQLVRALDITTLNKDTLLSAVNLRRKLLGLGPITALTSTVSLKDGLLSASSPTQSTRIQKTQAISDVRKLSELITSLSSPKYKSQYETLKQKLSVLNGDPIVVESVTREQFLKSALELFSNDTCPVCDTPWDPDKLREIIQSKLKHFQDVTAKRSELERELEPINTVFLEAVETLSVVEKYGTLLSVDVKPIGDLKNKIKTGYDNIKNFIPIALIISTLDNIAIVSTEALQTIAKIDEAISKLPEPTQQDSARDYLVVCQERFETYKLVSLRHKRAEEQAALAQGVFSVYAKVSTSILDGIYKEVEKDFSEMYQLVNLEDESTFTALLTPSMGKLGFDVDFYGRGFFPPGAYHSEGHQDGMGICLYLALMKHLLGDNFTFAVLDDVLMSVDSGHRRDVCKLLREKFPNTQFILTTHDKIWLQHMKAEGLIPQQSFINFRKWTVDQGPVEWSDRDIWAEINTSLGINDVRSAASLLRHYLEYITAEICRKLRARVEFRDDSQFQLGELLPPAASQLKKTLQLGIEVARSWGKTTEAIAIEGRKKVFTDQLLLSNVENWMINPAVHYNNWENFQSRDFIPVVDSYRKMIESFYCPECQSLLYIVPDRGPHGESLRCQCGSVNINLVKK